VPALSLFWLGPLSVVWSISERREGREAWVYTVAGGLLLAAIGTALLLRRSLPKHQIALILAAILTWCVSYFGGSSGAADNMRPFYSFFGLSAEATWNLVLFTRKTIHVTFYSALATCFFIYLGPSRSQTTVKALALTLLMACCDEWRQSMMPNRAGSMWDVLLDTGAAFLWIWWRYLRKSSAKSKAHDSDVHA
jgi:VanZ family protein